MWGCLEKFQVFISKRVKIRPNIVDCVFIKYATTVNHVTFLIHKSEHLNIHNNTVTESDNVEFFEHIYPYKTRHELSSEEFKRPRDEPKKNVLNKENLRHSNNKGHQLSLN